MTNSRQSGFGQLSTLLWAFMCYIFKMESYHFLSSLPALALNNYLLIGEAGWRGWPGVEWNLLFIAMRFCTRAHPRPGAGRPPPCTGPKHSRHRIHRLSVCASLGLYPRKPKQSWICMSRLEWRKGSLQLSGDHRKSWTLVPSSSARSSVFNSHSSRRTGDTPHLHSSERELWETSGERALGERHPAHQEFSLVPRSVLRQGFSWTYLKTKAQTPPCARETGLIYFLKTVLFI